jgi:alpha-beta hydrolase superfamily lysophospholipase
MPGPAARTVRQALSVRTRPVGGRLAERVQVSGLRDADNEDWLVILVHGFNTDTARARDRYGRFLDRLVQVTGDARLADHVWGFYWPGDEQGFLRSLTSYPDKVPVAVDAGALLARWLAERRTGLRVVVVAHSLGCRLSLDALDRLAESAAELDRLGAKVVGLVLMAAAVPVGMCKPQTGRFGFRPGYRSECVLYSRSDGTLERAFWLGQAKAGEALLGRAVGYTGEPRQRWTQERIHTGHEHNEYFDSTRAASAVAWLLGYRPARSLPGDPLPDSPLPTAALPVRPLPSEVGGVGQWSAASQSRPAPTDTSSGTSSG